MGTLPLVRYPVRGSIRSLIFFDAAEEIDLKGVRACLQPADLAPEPVYRKQFPEYLRFERPPVLVHSDSLKIGGEACVATVRLYDYGVIAVEIEQPYDLYWGELIALVGELVGSAEVDHEALRMARQASVRFKTDFRNLSEQWMTEDYCIVTLLQAEGDAGQLVDAQEMLAQHGGELAQIVRGEARILANSEVTEVLRSRLSYYPDDLLLVGWNAAVIVDTDEGAQGTRQILEFANTQLLEFRFYDELLTSVLAKVYASLNRRRGLLFRWKLAREAEELNRIRLDITELAERADNSLKFLGDMYYARVYRLAAERLGVLDYRRLVDAKLRTAGEIYDSMVNEFQHGRAFLLELAVVIILIIDLYFILREAKVI